MEEQKQPPLICEFFAVLEEAVDVGPHALAQHLNRYRRDIFTKLDQESNLEATLRLWEDPNWMPRSDLQLAPDHFLCGFPVELRKAAATYSNWLQQA